MSQTRPLPPPPVNTEVVQGDSISTNVPTLPFQNVLVALACAETDRGLLEYAAMLGRFGDDIRFHLVHVAAEHDKQTEDAARRCIRDVTPDGLKAVVSSTVLHGDRLDTLLRYTVDHKTDLVLLGHRRSRSGRRSLARRLGMQAPHSVWLVPEGCPAKLDGILAPVDLSPRSADSLGVAVSIAAAARLQRIHALHVWFNESTAMAEGYGDVDRFKEHEQFQIFASRLDGRGVDVVRLLEESADVPAAILRAAEANASDLIVMGTRGRSAAASILLGSETEQTMIQSGRPVLAVKHYGSSMKLIEVLLEDLFENPDAVRFT
jgi:SulP family sulfate permease